LPAIPGNVDCTHSAVAPEDVPEDVVLCSNSMGLPVHILDEL
jgi:hypothetical protein